MLAPQLDTTEVKVTGHKVTGQGQGPKSTEQNRGSNFKQGEAMATTRELSNGGSKVKSDEKTLATVATAKGRANDESTEVTIQGSNVKVMGHKDGLEVGLKEKAAKEDSKVTNTSVAEAKVTKTEEGSEVKIT
jgi:hypothetical protein